MSDWFKFYNDALDSKGMQFAVNEQPLVTSVWLVILSEASKNRSPKISWSDKDFELIGFSRKVNVSVPIFNQCLAILERIGYIKRGGGSIIIPGWDRLQSDYAKGLDRGYYKKTSEKLASDSEVSTVRGEERRGEEKRENKNCASRKGLSSDEKEGRAKDIELLKQQLGSLFKRNGRAWTNDEEFTLFEICQSGTAPEELKRILALRSRMSPDDLHYFPRSIISILRNWSKLLDTDAIYQPKKTGEEQKAIEAAMKRWA